MFTKGADILAITVYTYTHTLQIKGALCKYLSNILY